MLWRGIGLLAERRRQGILEQLEGSESVSVSELCERFGVSDMTIRRDLDALSTQNLLKKVHGGAVRTENKTGLEPHFAQKRSLQLVAKKAIAREAASLVQAGDTVAFSAGTTTWHVAAELSPGEIDGHTFVTNSTNVALVLQENGWDQIVLSGGSFRTPSDALVGPFAERTLRALNPDVLFLGVHGVDVEAGLTTPNIAEAETNRVLVEAARKVVVVADHTKLGVVALARMAPLSNIDIFITDRELHPEDAARFDRADVRVVVADHPER